MDILSRNLNHDASSKDDFAKITGEATDNLTILVKSIRSCSVPVATWTSKSGDLDRASLSGTDKKLLKELPEMLLLGIHEDIASDEKLLWLKFKEIYETITDKAQRDYDATVVSSKLSSFIHIL